MKTPSPGFQPGEHWNICDVCGFAYRESELLLRWDGAVVCEKDYEERHPQTWVRGVKDDTSPDGLHRSEPTDQFTAVSHCYNRRAESGNAESGCAEAGNTDTAAEEFTVPSGTFTT